MSSLCSRIPSRTPWDSHRVSLDSCGLGQFLKLSVFPTTVTVRRGTGRVFCGTSCWDLPGVGSWLRRDPRCFRRTSWSAMSLLPSGDEENGPTSVPWEGYVSSRECPAAAGFESQRRPSQTQAVVQTRHLGFCKTGTKGSSLRSEKVPATLREPWPKTGYYS